MIKSDWLARERAEAMGLRERPAQSVRQDADPDAGAR
jgi:hypothetical protein